MNILSIVSKSALISILLSGCGLSTFTQRETDPFIRDIIGNAGKPITIMITDSSRRLVYEFNNAGKPPTFCADAPPDTSIAASGIISGDVTATIPSGTPGESGTGSLKGFRSSNASIMPLIRRSQGLQWGRDQAATECLLYAMGVIKGDKYIERLDKIRTTSAQIIIKEIDKGLGAINPGEGITAQEPPVQPTGSGGN